MTIKGLLKKKNATSEAAADSSGSNAGNTPTTPAPLPSSPVPEFTFYRTDTNTQEVIQPPQFAEDKTQDVERSERLSTSLSQRLSIGRRRKSSAASTLSHTSEKDGPVRARRLSERFHLSRTSSASSVHLPSDLPSIPDAYRPQVDEQDQEAQWEDRATRLAKEGVAKSPDAASPAKSASSRNSSFRGRSVSTPLSPQETTATNMVEGSTESRPRSRTRSVSDAAGDENIQEAIRLHEAGELTSATKMFGRLAETGNVLSQVLYGLSLRHGWGIEPDPANAVTYLRTAASNSAAIEADALKAGMKKGGAAKGELVLAIFELANCFRHGWGVEIDKVAARQYYETAAHLGDVDAMNEAAWCYMEGYGGKKDRVSLAFTQRITTTNDTVELLRCVLDIVSNPPSGIIFARHCFIPPFPTTPTLCLCYSMRHIAHLQPHFGYQCINISRCHCIIFHFSAYHFHLLLYFWIADDVPGATLVQSCSAAPTGREVWIEDAGKFLVRSGKIFSLFPLSSNCRNAGKWLIGW